MQILWRLKQSLDQNLRSWFSLPDFLSTGGKSFSLAVFLETRESVSLLGLHALGISSLCSLIGALCSASMIRVRLEDVVILLAAHSGKQGSEVRSQGRTGTLVHSIKSTPPSCTCPTNAYPSSSAELVLLQVALIWILFVQLVLVCHHENTLVTVTQVIFLGAHLSILVLKIASPS